MPSAANTFSFDAASTSEMAIFTPFSGFEVDIRKNEQKKKKKLEQNVGKKVE